MLSLINEVVRVDSNVVVQQPNKLFSTLPETRVAGSCKPSVLFPSYQFDTGE